MLELESLQAVRRHFRTESADVSVAQLQAGFAYRQQFDSFQKSRLKASWGDPYLMQRFALETALQTYVPGKTVVVRKTSAVVEINDRITWNRDQFEPVTAALNTSRPGIRHFAGALSVRGFNETVPNLHELLIDHVAAACSAFNQFRDQGIALEVPQHEIGNI